ncbi:MAG: GNAT family N-acetyltransferase [Noviherbaspirillum sp.]
MDNAVYAEVSATRFELRIEGCAAGFIEYYLFDSVAIVTHTEIHPGREGKGLGAELVRQALDYLRGRQMRVVPVCGFFAHQMRSYPGYADLLTPQCRRIFNL